MITWATIVVIQARLQDLRRWAEKEHQLTQMTTDRKEHDQIILFGPFRTISQDFRLAQIQKVIDLSG